MMRTLSLAVIVLLSAMPLHAIAQQGWVSQTSGTNVFLEDVWAIDTTTCIAVGVNGTLLRTTDGGTIWGQVPSGTTAWLNSLGFTPAGTGFIVGDSGIVLRTTDAGEHWMRWPSGTTNNLRAISFHDSTVGVAVGERGTVLRSTNGGTDWTVQQLDSLYYLWGAAVLSQDSAIIIGIPFAAGPRLILRTTNRGTSWETISTGGTQPLYSIFFTNGTTGTAVGAGGTILRTTDGGTSWSTQSSPTAQSLYGLWFADAEHGTAVGNDVIVHTTDGGTTWSVQRTAGPQLNAVSFADVDVGYAVGVLGTILRTSTGGVLAADGNGAGLQPAAFHLRQNYPNPFNPMTRIEYEIPHAAQVRLALMDIVGRELGVLVDELQQPGIRSVTFDASALASGLYFYRLQAGTFAETRKLLLLR